MRILFLTERLEREKKNQRYTGKESKKRSTNE